MVSSVSSASFVSSLRSCEARPPRRPASDADAFVWPASLSRRELQTLTERIKGYQDELFSTLDSSLRVGRDIRKLVAMPTRSPEEISRLEHGMKVIRGNAATIGHLLLTLNALYQSATPRV